MRSLLLDTCAIIWVTEDAPMADAAIGAIKEAIDTKSQIAVSPMSAWEVGLLVTRGRLAMSMEPKIWFERFVAQPGIRLGELTPAILIDSSSLPGEPPRDPVDRIILATARANDLVVVTRDRLILDYAAAGHVKALAC